MPGELAAAIDHTSPVPYYAQVKETLRGPSSAATGKRRPSFQRAGAVFDVRRQPDVIRQALTS